MKTIAMLQRTILFLACCILCVSCSTQSGVLLGSAGLKAAQALTLTDAQIESYVKEYITAADQQNKVCRPGNPYADRLERIVGNFNNKGGINIKAYETKDVNAFACADGSIRVYTGLMDIMSDEEILGVVGHEIGHIHNKDTKNAFRTALLTSAALEGISSAGGAVANLSNSQFGAIGEALVNARFSQKQEYAADQYGYEFLKRNGINPWAMALSFEKLQKMQEASGSGNPGPVQQLFSTHPDITARTKMMADRAAAEGFKRPGSTLR